MFTPGARGFPAFAKAVGLDLQPFQRRIAKLVLTSPESLVLLPRGAGKSMLLAAVAVHHLLTEPRASVYVAAASREQATVVFAYAKAMAEHPAVADQLLVRHLELRARDGGRLTVLASDARLLHGLTPSLVVVDELHAHKSAEVYIALRTAMLKRPGSRMATISTAGSGAESPLGVLRARCLALPSVKRRGALTEAHGPQLAMLAWEVGDDEEPDAPAAKRANPASWLTVAALAAQRDALPEAAWRRYHCNQWLAVESPVFAAGAWQACKGEPVFEDGCEIVVAVDASKGASDAAVAWICEHDGRLQLAVEIVEGTGSAEALDQIVGELALRYRIREVAADPWHVAGLLTERWEQRGLTVSEFPQYDSRVVPATARLVERVNEGGLVHPGDEQLDAHVEGAMMRDTRRGPRLDKRHGRNNDGLVAAMMAIDRLEHKPPEMRFLGWIG